MDKATWPITATRGGGFALVHRPVRMQAVIGRKLFLQSRVLPIGETKPLWAVATLVLLLVIHLCYAIMQLCNEVLLCFFYVRVGRQSLIRQLQSRSYSITVEMRFAEGVLVYEKDSGQDGWKLAVNNVWGKEAALRSLPSVLFHLPLYFQRYQISFVHHVHR